MDRERAKEIAIKMRGYGPFDSAVDYLLSLPELQEKPASFGVTKEQIEDALDAIPGIICRNLSAAELRSQLAAALAPKWNKGGSVDRHVLVYNDLTKKYFIYVGSMEEPHLHWLNLPGPPPETKEEEASEFGELVKRLKALDRNNDYSVGLSWAIDEIKKMESERREAKK